MLSESKPNPNRVTLLENVNLIQSYFITPSKRMQCLINLELNSDFEGSICPCNQASKVSQLKHFASDRLAK